MADGPALQQEDELIAGMSGLDRMRVDLPEVDPDALDKIEAYKKSTKDIDLDGKKDNMWKRFHSWWKKGAPGGDDPTTPDVDEGAEDYEVTKFMGGMTRQELGMFVFEWGGLMMANSDQGFGGAMGAAGLGAMQGHQARGALAEEKALAEREYGLREREVAAAERRAAASGLSEAYTNPETGMLVIPKWDNEVGDYVMTETDQPGPLTSADRPYAKEIDMKALEESGFFSEEELAEFRADVPGVTELVYDAGKVWDSVMTKEGYPKGLVSGTQIGGGRVSKTTWDRLSVEQQDKLREEWVAKRVKQHYASRMAISDERAAQRALQENSQ